MNELFELSEAVVAAAIITIGLFGIGLAALRSASGNRAPLWLGLFGCLYGVRLATQSELVQPLLAETFWHHLAAAITYFIIVPGALFLESLVGPGWRLSIRRMWQAVLGIGFLATVNDIVRGQPEASMWVNRFVVPAAGSVAIAHLLVFRRWGEWPREFRAAVGAALVFLGVALFETFNSNINLEHFAMLLLMVSLGYGVTRRMLESERRLVVMSRDLEIAGEIQRSLLPRALPSTRGIRVAACCLPMTEVGGDFYDFDSRRGNGLGVIVADVSGHGVPAALVASMVKMGFAAETEHIDRPDVVLRNINRVLCGKFEGAFVTACCGFIDTVERRLRYASAGHPAPLFRRGDGRVEQLDQRGPLLALDVDAVFAAAEVALNEGDRLVFFSDGLVDARNPGSDFFGEARLERLLAADAISTAEQFVEHVVADLRRWIGSDTHLQDDVTVVVIDVGESGPGAGAAGAAGPAGKSGEPRP